GHRHSDIPGESHLRDRHRNAAVRAIMHRRDEPALDEVPDARARALLCCKIDRRRLAVAAAVADVEPERLADMALAVTNQDEVLAFGLETDRRAVRPVVEEAHSADRRRWQDGAATTGRLALVVERHVAAHDR